MRNNQIKNSKVFIAFLGGKCNRFGTSVFIILFLSLRWCKCGGMGCSGFASQKGLAFVIRELN